MQPFRIQTLSSLERCNTSLSSRSRLGFDPVTIIIAGQQVLNQLFPNFLGSAEPMTDSDLNTAFPGSGFWATQIKGYLRSRTRYKKDIQFWTPGNYGPGGAWSRGYIAQFVLEHHNEICPEVNPNCWSGTVCQQCMQIFAQKLASERMGSGDGSFPGVGLIDWQTILLIGGGVLLLVALNKKKRKK